MNIAGSPLVRGYKPVGVFPVGGKEKTMNASFQPVQFGAAEDRLETKPSKPFELSKTLRKQFNLFFNPVAEATGVGVVYHNLTPSMLYPTAGSVKEIRKETASSVLHALVRTLSSFYLNISEQMAVRGEISDGQAFTPYIKAQLLFRLGIYDEYAKGFKTGTFQTELPLANVPKLPNKIQQKTDILLKSLHDELLSHISNFKDPSFMEISAKEGRMSFENILPFDPDGSGTPWNQETVPTAEDLILSPPEKIECTQYGGENSPEVGVGGDIEQTFLLPDLATGQNNLLARVNTRISFSYPAVVDDDDMPNNFLPSPAVDEVIRTLYREQAQGGIQPLLNALTAKDLRKEELIEKHGRKTMTKKQLGWKSDGTGQLWGSTLPWPEKRTVPVLIEALGKTVDLEITIPSIEFKDVEGKSYRIINFGEWR